MRLLKKYPNRRLYDTQDSVYVTLEDVRQMVLANESIQVVDSKTGADLTRSVLLQIIAEQESEGHEPLLTNRLLQQLIRFYGDSMQGVLSKYIEQSVMVFLEQQEVYRRRMQSVLKASPLRMMQKVADQNIAFWRNLLQREEEEAARGAMPSQPPGIPVETTPDAPGAPGSPELGEDEPAPPEAPAGRVREPREGG